MEISTIAIFYNSEKYIKKCIDSILSQSYTDFELIAIDDCSKDSTINILNEYASIDSRVKVISHKVNKGIASTRNTGLKYVSGDCFYFIDGDDWLPSNAFENLVKYFSKDVDWVQGGYDIVNEKDDIIGQRSNIFGNYNSKEDIRINFGNIEFIWLHNRLINSKYSNRYFKEGIIHEDQFWNLSIYNELSNIVNLNTSTYNYVKRSSSFSNGSRFSRKFIVDGISLIKESVKRDTNWQLYAQQFAVSTIIKNMYLSSEVDSAFRKKTLNDLFDLGVYPICFNIGGYPRMARIIYSLRYYPDIITNTIAKTYKIVKKVTNKPM